MIHQLPWIGIAASHVKTKQIMYINAVLNTPSSSNQSKRAEDEYIWKEIPQLNYILFAFSPQYMTWPTLLEIETALLVIIVFDAATLP